MAAKRLVLNPQPVGPYWEKLLADGSTEPGAVTAKRNTKGRETPTGEYSPYLLLEQNLHGRFRVGHGQSELILPRKISEREEDRRVSTKNGTDLGMPPSSIRDLPNWFSQNTEIAAAPHSFL